MPMQLPYMNNVPITAIMGTIYLRFNVMDIALLYACGHSPADKIEERITFALIHARLYSSESYDEQDDKSASTNTFDRSCGDGGLSSSLSVING